MADWKLEQVNIEHSRIDTLAEGEKGDGLVWLLTVTNERDIYVFAGGPLMYQACKLARDYVGDAHSPEAVALFELLDEAIKKAEGVKE